MAIRFLSGQTIDGTLSVTGNVQAATFNTLPIATGVNNVANQIVRTQANGYVDFGWINSISGNHTGSITRITASNDQYLRYVTPAQFRTGVTDGFYAPASTVSGVTSVATGNGLTGGTITSTGTLSMSGSYTGTFTSTAVATDNIITSAGSLIINDPLDQNSNLIIAGRYDLGSTTLSFRSGHSGNSNVWDMATILVEDDANYNGRIMFRTSPVGYGNTPTTKMTIRSSGAIAFGTGISDYGSSGQVLKSNGNASPTWVDASTVIGGPYLPLSGGTVTGLTSFTASESIRLKGIRGQFTNEFMHLYNKVGIGNPAGWGQGETSTPNQGLSTYGAGYFAYGTGAASTFLGDLTVSKGTPIIKALDGTNNHYLFIAADASNSFMRSDNNLLLQVDGGNVTALTFDNVGSATFSGYTYFPNYLFHAGDTNTRIFFETGKITLRGDTNILLTGGNVGIGTTSPSGKLDVESTSTSTSPVIEITNTSSITYNHSINAFAPNLANNENNIFIIGKSGDTKNSGYIGYKWKADADNSNILTFGHWASNNLMNLTGDGKLGIGTESPTSKLTIDNGSTAGGSLLKSSSSSYTAHFIANTGSGNAGIYCDASNGDFIGSDYVFFGQHDDKWAQISTGPSASGIRFMPADSIKMVINNSGDVGIGTTAPAGKLDVIIPNLGTSSGDEVNGVFIQGSRHDWIFKQIRTANGSDWNNTTLRLQTRVDSTLMSSIDFVSDSSYNRHVDINTASNAFNTRFTHGGNVGIGTNDPFSRLQVGTPMSGNELTIGGYYISGGGSLNWRSGHPSNSAVWNMARINVTDDGNYNGRMEFKTTTSGGNSGVEPTQKMVLKANGRLGIGTTSPSALLHLYSAAAGGLPMLQVMSHATAAGSFTGNYMAEFCHAFSGVNHAMLIKNNEAANGRNTLDVADANGVFATFVNGKVGIGTTSPLNKLHVDGNIQIGGWTTAGSRFIGTARIDNGAFTAGSAGMEVESVTESGLGNYDQKIHLTSHRYNGGTSRVLTASFTSGNNRVGIGDTTPSYTLDAVGTIRATGDVIAYSDARVKDNVKTIDNALEKVKKLRGVSYTRNDIEDKSTKVGVIAQEVLKVLPEVVDQDENDKYSVSYGNITGVLIEAIKEQQKQIEYLKIQIKNMSKDN